MTLQSEIKNKLTEIILQYAQKLMSITLLHVL